MCSEASEVFADHPSIAEQPHTLRRASIPQDDDKQTPPLPSRLSASNIHQGKTLLSL
jgi:hypothetical protein